MSNLQKNVASQNITYGLISATTGAGTAGLTVATFVTKDNGTQATGTGTTTDKGNGQYNYAPTQAETNATDVGFAFTATGAIPVYYDFHTDVVDANGFASVNVADVAGQTASAASGVTFPSSIASPTNITAGTITTVTNLTNAPTSGDFTATMKTSLNSSTPASVTTVTGNVNGSVGSVTGAVGSVTGSVGSVAGNVSGNVTGSVGSVTGLTNSTITAAVLTTAMTESYPVKGSTITLAQAAYNINQQIGERGIVGTTASVKNRAQSSVVKTYTLDSATAPTTITEAT